MIKQYLFLFPTNVQLKLNVWLVYLQYAPISSAQFGSVVNSSIESFVNMLKNYYTITMGFI